MKSRKASMNINRKVHDECVLPVMVYGSETVALKKVHMELLSVAKVRNGAHHARHHPTRPQT